MLERATASSGVVYYRSTLFQRMGIPHAFTTRIGGVSTGPFASLNLGTTAQATEQDSLEHIRVNFQRAATAINLPEAPIAWVHQIHGKAVAQLPRREVEKNPAFVQDQFSGQIHADALVSDAPGILLSIRVADCVPILLAARDGGIVAGVHAGWRGVAGNIVRETTSVFASLGVPPGKMIAAIGPAISASHFEVGMEVAEAFAQVDLVQAVHTNFGARPHVDLVAAVKLQLQRGGLKEDQIDTSSLCTYSDSLNFYSHRRDQGQTGRMAALIGRR